MTRIVMLLALIVASFFGYADEQGITDTKLREILTTTFLDLHPVKRDVEATLAKINFASNRLVVAAKDVYFETTERRSKMRAMSVVSSYGTPEDLDFIVSCATNHEYWESAAIGVLKLSGVTTNSVSQIDGLMNCEVATNGVHNLESEKGFVISALLRHALKTDVSSLDKAMAWSYALTYASNHVNQAESMDSAFKHFNPAYEHSRTRKGLLSYWHTCPANEYCRDYVARELDALNQVPESALDE